MQAKRENSTTDWAKAEKKKLFVCVQVRGLKTTRLPCCRQKVSRCRTRDKLEESKAQSTQARGSTLDLKPKAELKPKTGLSMAQQKGLMSSKQFLKNNKLFVKRRQSKNDLPDRAERNLNCLDIRHTADCG